MKKSTLAVLLVFASLGLVRSDELIKNGDFSQGTESWRGDVQAVDASSVSPLDTTPAKAGLVINLSQTNWTKVYQDFTGVGNKLTIKVDYQLSADASFSTNGKDYDNVSHAIGYNAWKPFHIPVGTWVLMMSDFGPDKGRYYTITPKFGSTETQSFTVNPPGKDQEKKTLTLAFPPGTGTVTLLKISVQD